MYPRAIAKRKICKVGRACGLGCVPKKHNCKRPLRHQAKTAVQWLAHVTANSNYEAEVNAITDKRLKRFNQKVKAHESHRNKGDKSGQLKDGAAIADNQLTVDRATKKDITEIKGYKDNLISMFKDESNDEHRDIIREAIHIWDSLASKATPSNTMVIKGKNGIEGALRLSLSDNYVHAEYFATHPDNLLGGNGATKGIAKLALVTAAEFARKMQRGLWVSDQGSVSPLLLKLGLKQNGYKVFTVEKDYVLPFINGNQQKKISYKEVINSGKQFIRPDLLEGVIAPVVKIVRDQKKILDDSLKQKETLMEKDGITEKDKLNLKRMFESEYTGALRSQKTFQLLSKAMAIVRNDILLSSSISAEQSSSMAHRILFADSLNDERDGTKHDQQKLRDNITEFFRITNGMGRNSIEKIEMLDDRAHASRLSGSINIGTPSRGKDTKNVLFHEAGHHIEFESGYLRDAAVDWLLSRSTSETPLKLSEITGWPFEDDEVAYPDKFTDPYVGKVYPESTEVISTGIERFASPEDMSEFFVSDPEHFYFILGILRGNYV